MKPNNKARAVLDAMQYMTIATVSDNGEPWNSPVFFVYDENYNLYWASDKQSQHSRNIQTNDMAFIAVYDSTVPWGEGVGVFIQATAEEVTDPDEIAKACQLRRERVSLANQPPSDFIGDRPRRIYRAVPQKIWMNEDSDVNGYFVDIRIEAEA